MLRPNNNFIWKTIQEEKPLNGEACLIILNKDKDYAISANYYPYKEYRNKPGGFFNHSNDIDTDETEVYLWTRNFMEFV